MAYDNQNVFAKVLRGEVPCHKVFEDEHTLVFMDLMPQINGHTLVIPKQAAETIFELTDEELCACIKTTKKIAAAAKIAFNVEGVAIGQLNGVAAGQTVPHVHFHIFPGSMIEIINRPHAAVIEKPEILAENAQRLITVLAQ